MFHADDVVRVSTASWISLCQARLGVQPHTVTGHACHGRLHPYLSTPCFLLFLKTGVIPCHNKLLSPPLPIRQADASPLFKPVGTAISSTSAVYLSSPKSVNWAISSQTSISSTSPAPLKFPCKHSDWPKPANMQP